MPSPKRGGVGEGAELGKRIREAGGTLEWKADKLGVIRARMCFLFFHNEIWLMNSCCKSKPSGSDIGQY
jgi:hypothetical protein